mgnify:CR=1 FL=1
MQQYAYNLGSTRPTYRLGRVRLDPLTDSVGSNSAHLQSRLGPTWSGPTRSTYRLGRVQTGPLIDSVGPTWPTYRLGRVRLDPLTDLKWIGKDAYVHFKSWILIAVKHLKKGLNYSNCDTKKLHVLFQLPFTQHYCNICILSFSFTLYIKVFGCWYHWY